MVTSITQMTSSLRTEACTIAYNTSLGFQHYHAWSVATRTVVILGDVDRQREGVYYTSCARAVYTVLDRTSCQASHAFSIFANKKCVLKHYFLLRRNNTSRSKVTQLLYFPRNGLSSETYKLLTRTKTSMFVQRNDLLVLKPTQLQKKETKHTHGVQDGHYNLAKVCNTANWRVFTMQGYIPYHWHCIFHSKQVTRHKNKQVQ